MSCQCPECESCVHNEETDEPMLVRCPECGADLYPEEVIFQYLICGVDGVAA